MKIALTGNPNSGKTTTFNALTGSSEKVGNWAGVTVDTKEGTVKKNFCDEEIVVVDLPGAYSMSAFTSEENITSDYVKNEKPDVIINVVDATNLSRSLFFTTQLLELGIPLVVALNKTDVNDKKETKINTKLLSEKLGCPAIKTVSTTAEGLEELIIAALEVVGVKQNAPYNQGNINFSDKDAVEAADRKRFRFVNRIVREVESRKVLTNQKNFQDKVDDFLTNKWLGIPIFAVVMYLVFQISQVWVGTPIADLLVGWLEIFQDFIRSLFVNANPLLSALLVDGIIGGVIAVVGFLPLVMVMYLLIALLEDCGYMARVSVVLDPIFKRVGLSGKSVIPFVIGIGCAVPGVMASRTIRDERERRATVMLAPFMPCGAKIPLISLFAGVFFENSGWVSTLMYLTGIIVIYFGALLVNKITAHRARKSFFIIELPEYKMPSFLEAFKSMCSRGVEYIVKAATVILICNTAVQIMQTFDWSLKMAQTADVSILATVAKPFAFMLLPVVGVLSWQLAAAAVTGFIAKENVVGTLAVCFSITNFIDTEELQLIGGANEVAAVMGLTKIAALAYLMFNLFSPPCFAAMGAMNSEMKSAKWLFGGIALQLGMGFSVGYLVYTIGTIIIDSSKLNITAAICGGAAIALMLLTVAALSIRASIRASKEKV